MTRGTCFTGKRSYVPSVLVLPICSPQIDIPGTFTAVGGQAQCGDEAELPDAHACAQLSRCERGTLSWCSWCRVFFTSLHVLCFLCVKRPRAWCGEPSRVPVSEEAVDSLPGETAARNKPRPGLSCSPGGCEFHASLSGRSINEASFNRNAQTRAWADQPEKTQ